MDNRYSGIYFNSGIEIYNVGINVSHAYSNGATTPEKALDFLDKNMNQIDSTPEDIIPLSKEITFFNDFRVKEQTIPALSQLYAYYYSNSSYLNNGALSFYKKRYEDNFYQYIADMEKSYGIMDYNIQANGYYHYLITYKNPYSQIYVAYESVDENGEPEYIQPKWDFWTICNIEQSDADENVYYKTGNTWKLRYNIESSQITQNTSVTTWDTLSRFPKYSVGQKNYSSASFTGFLGDITEYKLGKTEKTEDEISIHTVQDKFGYTEKSSPLNSYSREVDKYNSWKEFASDGKLKLLKDYKGNSWVVYIQESGSATIDMTSNLMQTVISFEWIEALDVDSITIISESLY